jgi:hypothetical protein
VALIHCTDCSREVSDRAPSCPGCGAPVATATLAPILSQPIGVPTPSTSPVIGFVALTLGLAGVIMPYFASVFIVPAAFICGVVAWRRGQRGMGGAAVALAILGLLGIMAVSSEIGSAAEELQKSMEEFERSFR